MAYEEDTLSYENNNLMPFFGLCLFDFAEQQIGHAQRCKLQPAWPYAFLANNYTDLCLT